jgi:hypothetical protein
VGAEVNLAKPPQDSSPGIVIIYCRGRLIWIEGELADADAIGARTVEALREISGSGVRAPAYVAPGKPPPTLH